MIQNLNRLSFQPYGAILPKLPVQDGWELPWKSITLTSQLAPAWKATADTYLMCENGMAVLSLSENGTDFHDFYLDKSVMIHEGIFFSLSPFRKQATIRYASPIAPAALADRPLNSLHITRNLDIQAIYTLFYQEKEQGFLFSGEAHPVAELTYVDQGSLHSVADGQDLLLKQGDIVIYGPDQWHMQYADIGVAPRYVTLSFDLAGADITPLLNRKFTAPQQVVQLLQQMLREQERMDAFSNDMIISQLNLLLLALLRESENPTGGKLQTSNAVHSENEIIRQAQIFISSHIREKLSVPLVARQVDVSPSYLTALFHKNLQISPGEYIRRIKLQESKQMIRENDLNITEIAAALQYSTVHHFSRQFKEKFGITPTEYAKSVR